MKHQYVLADPPFAVGNVDLQQVSRQAGHAHPIRSGRAKHGFIYTVSGQMQYIFESDPRKSFLVRSGEMIFIPRGSLYTGTYLENDTENKIVEFELERGTLPDYLSAPFKVELPQSGKLIDDFFDQTGEDAVGHPFYFLSCLYTLLWQIDKGYAALPARYKKLQPALTALTDRWQENRSVAYLAELCHMSEVNFRRLFREHTGTSPIAFRNDLRLKHARAMLGSGEYNVSEAAEASGFSNLSFFIRLYKKKYGHTPKKV